LPVLQSIQPLPLLRENHFFKPSSAIIVFYYS
jgi:hypothetical protein